MDPDIEATACACEIFYVYVYVVWFMMYFAASGVTNDCDDVLLCPDVSCHYTLAAAEASYDGAQSLAL